MKQIETAKFIAWLCGVFPQWKPDATVAPTWAQELPDMTGEQAAILVRKIQAKKPSPFPPSAFEVLAELTPSSKLDARKIWVKIIDRIQKRGVRDYPYDLTDMEKQAVRLMGGIEVLANSNIGDPFIEKRFLEVCDNLKEKEKILAIEGTGARLQIGPGEEGCPLKLTS